MAKRKYTILGTVSALVGGKRTDMLKVKYQGDDWWVLKPLNYFNKK
jgi:hypothetical protein